MSRRHALLVPALLSLAAGLPLQAAAPLRVLILSGRNNHAWQQTTPALVETYAGCGRFRVEVLERPETLTPSRLAGTNVVVSNWTNFPSHDRIWGPAAEEALLDFVRAGGGFVVVHAASACFPDWPAYQHLMGATWGAQTGHGKIHRFRVDIADHDHPITAGLPSFVTRDELWHRMQIYPTAHVLCRAFSDPARGGTGEKEPVAYWTTLERGRCFHLVLGHDVEAMRPPAWRLLLQRGTQWAATGRADIEVPVDLDRCLTPLADLDVTADRRVLEPVEQLVALASGYPRLRVALAARFASRLAGAGTVAYKEQLLTWLSAVGSAAELGVLASCLHDPDLAEPARQVIETIPGDAACATLRQALPQLTGSLRIGVLHALGRRRDRAAVAVIRPYTADTDSAVAQAALTALGRIGTPEALAALPVQSAGLPGPLAQARLQCAGRLAEDGDTDRARAVYRKLVESAPSAALRRAAFNGLVSSAPGPARAGALLRDALTGDDPVLQQAALAALPRLRDAAARRTLAAAHRAMAPAVEAALLDRLAATQDVALLPVLTEALASDAPPVREAAVRALGALGTVASVPPLVTHLTTADGPEREHTRRALVRLADPETDPALLRRYEASADALLRRALARTLAERRCAPAVPVYLTLARDPQETARREALQALADLGDAAQLPAVLDLLERAPSQATRDQTESTLVDIAERSQASAALCRQLRMRLPAANADAQASLLRVAARLGGDSARSLTRTTLAGDDPGLRLATLRALSLWPSDLVLGDLIEVATHSRIRSEQVLALRAFVHVLDRVKDPDDPALHAQVRRALAAAPRIEERRLLLAALVKIPAPAGLDLAVAALEDAATRGDAALAVVGLARVLGTKHPQATQAALRQVLTAAVPPRIQEQARSLLPQ